ADYTLDHITIYPRQDNCCADRLSNVRVAVHISDFLDNIGDEVWHADLFTDGSNAGSTPGTNVIVRANMGTGTFAGRWLKITSLANPVPSFALQVNEIEAYAEGPVNVALGAAATASAVPYVGRSPSLLVNGVRGGGEVLHGDAVIDPGYHYDLNLGAVATIQTIKIIARQDGCCPERLSNYRVSVHSDDAGAIGPEVWGASLHTDGSNPGSGPGSKDVLTADFDPGGVFAGQWIRLESLDNPVPSYALQMTEVEVYGTLAGGPQLRVLQQPA